MAKKFNLREFQTTLSQKLQPRRAATTAVPAWVSGGDVKWLVSLSDTEEVIPVPPIVKVPGACRWFARRQHPWQFVCGE